MKLRLEVSVGESIDEQFLKDFSDFIEKSRSKWDIICTPTVTLEDLSTQKMFIIGEKGTLPKAPVNPFL
jgi:hypothetical protein